MRHDQHITHLIPRYLDGQLRPARQAQVVNHIRTCAACRAALAREERVEADLRREMPVIGMAARSGQLAQVWSGVWQDMSGPQARANLTACLAGIGTMVAVVLVLAVVLPLFTASGVRVEAAPQQPRPFGNASLTPGATETNEAQTYQSAAGTGANLQLPQATVAFVSGVGATPAPMPAATVSPDARLGSVHTH